MKDINERIAALSPEQRALFEMRLKQKNLQIKKSTSIPKRTASDILTLSLSQERLWLLHQLQPDTPLYNESSLLHLTGVLNTIALQKSINEIIKRHEILRTSFQVVDEQTLQIIDPKVTFKLTNIELPTYSETEVNQIVTEKARQAFDLSQAPLFRGMLIRISEQEHILLLTKHHIISDGWSWQIFYRELAALYQGFCQNIPAKLPELPIQYADFARWQKQDLQEKSHQLNYWKQKLKDAPPILNLPTDYPRPAQQSFQGARTTIIIPQILTDALKSFSQQEGVTLFMVLLAAFKTLLYRYTGQTDLSVGTPVANRTHSEIENLLGCFVNTLVLRTDVSGELSFKELVKRVRETALAAYTHQELPFEQLVKELQPERTLSHTPLFQVMFVFQDAPMLVLQMPNLTLAPLIIDNGSAKFDLTLYVEDTKQELIGFLEYNTDLFHADTVNRMVGHLQTLLEGVVANSQQSLCDLPLLTASERYQLLEEWNNTQVDYPQDQCIHQLFEAQVEKTPDAVAVVFDNQQLTYQEVNTKANQLAHYLQKLGVKPEVLVGICVERSLEMIIAILAVLKAGGAYIPLDPAFPQQRLALMLEDSQALILLSQKHLIESLSTHKAQIICLDQDWENIATQEITNPKVKVKSDNLIYTIYTSGSTGKPKGVQIIHSNVVNFLTAIQQELHLTHADSLLSVTTLSFDIAGLEIFLPLIIGAKLILVSREVATDGIQLLQQLNNTSTTVMQATPATWRMLLDAGWQGKSRLKVLCGGEALPQNLAEKLSSRSAQLWNLYGPTETTIWSTIHQIQDPKQTIPIGRPLANTQIYILDKSLQPVPVGVTGEIYIGGAGVARGYFNRPELTQEKFIANPFSDNPGEKLYKTGDLGRYLANGEIEYLGRIDYQIKMRGFRIELSEIETIINQHLSIQTNIVVLREDTPGNKTLVAYLTLQPEHSLTIEELRRFLESQLPGYMIPSAFVILETLPLTPNGKIDRASLPAPDPTKLIQSSHFVAASTPIENKLAEIWMEVLGINKVGIHDNFFELGGHSLLATQVISQVRKALGVEIPLCYLFATPTVAGLAKHIEKAINEKTELNSLPLIPVDRNTELSLSFGQQRLWFIHQLDPESTAYNGYDMVRLEGLLNVPALEESINEIVRRHEILRTCFAVFEGRPIQKIISELRIPLPIVDLQHLPEIEREKEVQRLEVENAQIPFDLSQAPLLRFVLLRLTQEEHILLVTNHHIISDAWSAAVLIKEVSILYQAFATGQLYPLPELPIQYADYAVWQQQWLQGERLDNQLNYWKKQLENAKIILELPTDNPRTQVQTALGKKHSFTLSSTLSNKLKSLSQQEGVTLFMTLLTAFNTLLYHYTQQEDILVGSPIANRNRNELEGLIGFFVNTLVLRTNLADKPTFRELLQRVKETALEAYAHQDLPFEKLVSELQLERTLNYSPLFQVWFVLQNTPKSDLKLAGLNLSILESESGTVRHDLKLQLTETPEGLQGFFEYKTDLFHATTINRMAVVLETLLLTVLEKPDIQLDQLVKILQETEKQQQIRQNQELQKNRIQKLGKIKRKAITGEN
ncbi:amino acid adenylation domain-containing protein [Anabaena sphaerica FACHB-251]|uniref:Amino acid adenylation domain-containing protein n=1 Tax=Anabaena sphaerica FACHB-251 TaxID=2692883 RepID=A0A926WFA0_9NOST|nr:non-ribosomal peptide synthetase [Anabaena sphaerica]MBD2293367.1 amino acid adenylation domain-containing protein [Anabaena sphaerica FACHB-251]